MHPTLRLAVALKYEHQQDVAPLVVAAGRSAMADSLVDKARDLGIPVHTDSPLAQALSVVPIGAFVPEDLYPVVAQVLAMVYAMDRQMDKQMDPQKDGQSDLSSEKNLSRFDGHKAGMRT